MKIFKSTIPLQLNKKLAVAFFTVLIILFGHTESAFGAPLKIASFEPLFGPVGTVVTISGGGFRRASEVMFGNVSATSFRVISDSSIEAVVPAHDLNTQVKVITGVGTALSRLTFRLYSAPLISQMSPNSGNIGTIISFTGMHFLTGTGVSLKLVQTDGRIIQHTPQVSLDGSQMTTFLSPAVSKSGTFNYTNQSRVTTQNFNFELTPQGDAPVITNISPTKALQGTPLVISGSKFTGVTSVFFVGTKVPFTFVSDNRIETIVPVMTQKLGRIFVLTPAGLGTSGVFTFVPPLTLSGFLPVKAAVGQSVVLSGANLGNVTGISFGSMVAQFSNLSETSVTAVVPLGAVTGQITARSPFGNATTTASFTVVPPPTLSGFLPAEAAVGQSVVLYGANLGNVTEISFGSMVAQFSNLSETSVTAVVPLGAVTGQITARSPFGNTTTIASFTVLLPPAISSFFPGVGAVGQSVTLLGANLGAVTSVLFNGVTATTFSIVSAGNITAVVPSGATSGLVSVVSPLGTSFSATSFNVNPLCNPVIDSTKELVVTDLSVVNDPRTIFNPANPANPGHWSFGFLMGKLAGETDFSNPIITSNFVKNWLNQFATVTMINGHPVTQRASITSFINSWPKLTGTTTLDFSLAPFRLLAITDRIDLRTAT